MTGLGEKECQRNATEDAESSVAAVQSGDLGTHPLTPTKLHGSLILTLNPDRPTMRHDPGRSMIFFNLCLVPEHTSFVCLHRRSRGSRLRSSRGSLRPHHPPACSCNYTPPLRPKNTRAPFSSLTVIVTKPPAPQLPIEPNAECGRRHHWGC